MTASIRVLVVDDSAFVRKVLRELIASSREFEVVGHARDGLDALEKIDLLAPEVLTLDLVMPDLDGVGLLRALAERPRPPRAVVVSTSAADSDLAIEALQLGAVDLVHKPTALATDRLYEMGDELLGKLRVAADIVRQTRPPPPPSARGTPLASPRPRIAPAALRAAVMVVGTSTGGPQALTRLFSTLPGDLPVPVVAVVHIPPGYTEALAERLDRQSALRVVEASEGLIAGPGMAVVARAGVHLRLARAGERAARCILDPDPPSLHRPSVDVLFTSAADAFGEATLAAVLTGMGDDGLRGARAIHAAGGCVLTEHPSSSIVDGMPRAVREAGLSRGEATLDGMAAALVDALGGPVS